MARDNDMTHRIGSQLLDRDGEPIGEIVQIFLDDDTLESKWALVDVVDRPGENVFVPLAGADAGGDAPRVAVSRDVVAAAPAVDVVDGRISTEHDEALQRHYAGAGGVPAPGSGTVTRHERVEDVPALVRSEEQLDIETVAVPRERVRLVKRVVTETVTRTVEVRREELHVERETVAGAAPTAATPETGADPDTARTDPPSQRRDRLPAPLQSAVAALERRSAALRGGLRPDGEPFADETVDVTLYEEQVVVTKRVVPRERVRLRRVATVDAVQVEETLRKERVELEDATRPREAT